MSLTRREFLIQTGQGCIGYALGAAAFAAGVHRFGIVNLLAQGSDYKALVCVFLAGGNDGNNLVVPTSTTEYNAYATVRSASGLAIPRDTLLPITPVSINSGFGLHPSLAELHALWSQQKVAIVCNAGPLVQPINRSSIWEVRRTRTSCSRIPIKLRSGRHRSPIESVKTGGADEPPIGLRHSIPACRWSRRWPAASSPAARPRRRCRSRRRRPPSISCWC